MMAHPPDRATDADATVDFVLPVSMPSPPDFGDGA
jgi:hypothetical protein